MRQLTSYHKWFWIIGYVILYLLILPYFQYKIVSDMVSYISISKYLVIGNFSASVNAYWSPLISWLITPFLYININGLLAYKIINLVAGVVIIFQLYTLSTYFLISALYRNLFIVVCIPQLLYFSLCNATPDILALACWLLFFNALIKLIIEPNFSKSIVVGLMGALCYTAKYYNFYACILFMVCSIMYCFVGNRKQSMGYIVNASFVFFIVCSIWMFQLYKKHGDFTPTTAATFNMNIINPSKTKTYEEIAEGNSLLPIDYNAFLTTSWEYPPAYKIPNWSPIQSISNFKNHITINIYKNILYYRNKHLIESLFFLVSVFVMLLYRNKITYKYWLLLGCIVLYPIGYFWIIAGSRYALFSILLSLLLSLTIIQKFISKINYGIIFCIVLASLYSNYIIAKRIVTYKDKGENYFNFYTLTQQQSPINNTKIISSTSTRAPALYWCYYSNSKFYDVLKPQFLKNNYQQLSELGVCYYFCLPSEIPNELKDKIVYQKDWVLIKLK